MTALTTVGGEGMKVELYSMTKGEGVLWWDVSEVTESKVYLCIKIYTESICATVYGIK